MPYASFSNPEPELSAFLLAPIWEERNGMLLSVLSAFARLNLDPWGEAKALARLPGEAAIRRLGALIADLPDRQAGCQDPTDIATRLVAFLPREIATASRSRQQASTTTRAVDIWVAGYTILMAIALGTQWFAASGSAPAQTTKTHQAVPVSAPSHGSAQQLGLRQTAESKDGD